MAMSELLKEPKHLQYNLEVCGCGPVEIVLHTDADVATQSAHKRGVGMKHLDARHCWLQEELARQAFKVTRVDRSENTSDAWTNAPSSKTWPVPCAVYTRKFSNALANPPVDAVLAG